METVNINTNKSNETKKIQLGEVFVSDKSMEDIDVEGDNTKKLPDEEKKIKYHS